MRSLGRQFIAFAAGRHILGLGTPSQRFERFIDLGARSLRSDRRATRKLREQNLQ